MITINLPFRPVGWKAPNFGQGRAYSNEVYATWKEEAVIRAKLQYHGEPMTGPIVIVVQTRVPDRRYGDLTNYVKAIEDAIQEVMGGAGIIKDDKQVEEQHNYRVIDRDNPGITVEVYSVDDCEFSLMRKFKTIDAYIEYHDMSDLVTRVTEATQLEFPDATLLLELVTDGTEQHLSLYVRYHEYPNDVLDRIEQRVWMEFEDEHAECSGWLLVTTDFTGVDTRTRNV